MYKCGFKFEITKNGIIGEIDGVTFANIYSVCFYKNNELYDRTNLFESTITYNLETGRYKAIYEEGK